MSSRKKKIKTEQLCQAGHTIFRENCRPCKTLKKEWYTHLKSEGFTDIEKKDDLVDHKNVLDLIYKQNYQTTVQFEAHRSYYQWAESKLNDGRFDSTKDRMIWECHAQGMTRRSIEPIVGHKHSWITKKIHRIEEYLKYQADCIIGSMSAQYAVG